MSDIPLLTALTPDHKKDLTAAAKNLATATVYKYADPKTGQKCVGFTQFDFVRIMKLVAGVHLLLKDNEALQKRVGELEAWQKDHMGLVLSHTPLDQLVFTPVENPDAMMQAAIDEYRKTLQETDR